jgi:hypothetical protein
MSEPKKPAQKREFIDVLEDGVREVLKNKEATVGERMAAINTGAKILMARFKISGDDEKNFFS